MIIGYQFNATDQPVTYGNLSGSGPNIYNEQIHALQIALFATKQREGPNLAAHVEAVCLVVKPGNKSTNTTVEGGAAATITTTNGAAVARLIPGGAAALALAGLGVVIGVL